VHNPSAIALVILPTPIKPIGIFCFKIIVFVLNCLTVQF
jgi:hypothetical protein